MAKKYTKIDVHKPKWSKRWYAIAYLPNFGGSDQFKFNTKKEALAWKRKMLK